MKSNHVMIKSAANEINHQIGDLQDRMLQIIDDRKKYDDPNMAAPEMHEIKHDIEILSSVADNMMEKAELLKN